MLNISLNKIDSKIDRSKYSVFQRLEKRSVSKVLIRLLLAVTLIGCASLFLPWTQNIRTKGYVTTLNPQDRPQDIMSVVNGKIEEWKVKEGDIVSVGDTLVILSEVKEEYMDPLLLEQTDKQIFAKSKMTEAYTSKISNLKQEYEITLNDLQVKLDQNDIKAQQLRLKLDATASDLKASETKYQNAINQAERINMLFEKGIKSLTQNEQYTLKVNEANAKVQYWENIIATIKTELNNVKQNELAITNSYQQKMAKLQSDISATRSQFYSAEGEKEKLQSELNKLEVRQSQFVIVSPIKGTITKTLKNGIGEIIKSGESISTIVPTAFTKAVELYVSPNDIPLLNKGKKLRLLFDGWPAIVFSGWPKSSYGTFGGELMAIDNDISKNGKYRVLVSEDSEDELWPDEVRVGGGATGIILLNRVPIYYEFWRQMNGFPADYYTKEKPEKIKSKAPIKKFK